MHDLLKWLWDCVMSVKKPSVRFALLGCVVGAGLCYAIESSRHTAERDGLRGQIDRLEHDRDAERADQRMLIATQVRLERATEDIQECKQQLSEIGNAQSATKRELERREHAEALTPEDMSRREEVCYRTIRTDSEDTRVAFDDEGRTKAKAVDGCVAKLLHRVRTARRADRSVQAEYTTDAGYSSVCSCSLYASRT